MKRLGELLGVIVASGLLAAEDPPVVRTIPATTNRSVVIAHRGDQTRAHGNTLQSIEAAIQAGADYVEVDVRQTRDGEFVLMHDAEVNGTTDGRGRLAQMTWEEVRRLRVLDRARPELAPSRIPKFSEALMLTRGRIRVYADFKAGDRTACAQVIRSAGVAAQVVIYDAPGAVARWRRVAPEVPLMVSPPAGQCRPDRIRRFIRRVRPDILDGELGGYDAATVRAAQAEGVPVWPDAQGPGEGPSVWQRAVELGVDGFQTDAPGRAVEWLRQCGRR